MKRFCTLAVLLAGSLALATQAQAFLIDGFGDAQEEVRVSTAEFLGGTTTKTGSALAITDTDFVGAMRTLTATMTGTGGTGSIEAEVGGNRYAHSQSSGVFGYTQVDWFDFDPVDFNPSDSLLVSLLTSDLGGEIAVSINGDTVTRALPATGPGDPPFLLAFNLADFASVTDVVSMSLRVDGTELADLDVSIGRVEVPAPAAIGLFGAGLLALAGVMRRRVGETGI